VNTVPEEELILFRPERRTFRACMKEETYCERGEDSHGVSRGIKLSVPDYQMTDGK
jgi:hypothetical protein